jgi:hypothetical protein
MSRNLAQFWIAVIGICAASFGGAAAEHADNGPATNLSRAQHINSQRRDVTAPRTSDRKIVDAAFIKAKKAVADPVFYYDEADARFAAAKAEWYRRLDRCRVEACRTVC